MQRRMLPYVMAWPSLHGSIWWLAVLIISYMLPPSGCVERLNKSVVRSQFNRFVHANSENCATAHLDSCFPIDRLNGYHHRLHVEGLFSVAWLPLLLLKLNWRHTPRPLKSFEKMQTVSSLFWANSTRSKDHSTSFFFLKKYLCVF